MTFLVSPGILVREFDLTTTIPAIAATPAAYAGVFRWGPVMQRILVDSENNLVSRFGKPTNYNGESWFTVASFLAYGGFTYVVRAGDTTGNTVVVGFAGNAAAGNLALMAGNNKVQVVNSLGVGVGMKLFYANTPGIDPNQDGGVYVAQVNSSVLTLTAPATGNAASAQLIFRDNLMYSAVAQEVVDYTNQWADQTVLNPGDFEVKDGTFDPSILFMARYPGALGNSLRVAVCDHPEQFASNTSLQGVANAATGVPNTQIDVTTSFMVANVGSNTLVVTVAPANTSNATFVTSANLIVGEAQASLTLGDLIETGNSSIGFQFMKVTGWSNVVSSGNVYSFTINCEDEFKLHANVQNASIERYWEFYNAVREEPNQSDYVYRYGNTSAMDEMHIVVVDEGGAFQGNPGGILEIYKSVSRATDAKNLNNTTNYVKDVINQQSQYIWWTHERTVAECNTAEFIESSTGLAPLNIRFTFGDDGKDEANIELGHLINGYDQYASPEEVDISLIMVGKGRGLPVSANTQLATWLLDNIAARRKDCIVLCSPDIGFCVNNKGFEAEDIAMARDTMPSTSYGVMDSGYKYMYDRYNDVYRWVPLNGDIAGLCAQTDMTNAPWWSPAGFNRGNIKNVVKLAWNPRESERDTLYTHDINPVCHFRDMGTVLYGDKTLFHKPSAFNRINVRRLFIVLEKAIATASKFTLFEFNDEFTRSQFKAMVNPFLKQIQGQRGITGFFVRCDQTNNTPWIIQNNEFVADIFIRPNYSINWILLNFINVPPTLSFAEAEAIQF